MNPFAHQPSHVAKAFQIVRDRQQRYGDVVIPRKVVCPCCNKARQAQDMPRIAHTGVVGNVMDCLCKDCTKEHGKEFAKLARIVCAGCREVVAVVSPGKEKIGGYMWEAGAHVHVAECPACSANIKLKTSAIAEKLVFYKRNGIPYE